MKTLMVCDVLAVWTCAYFAWLELMRWRVKGPIPLITKCGKKVTIHGELLTAVFCSIATTYFVFRYLWGA